jgi:hypothetical protein
LHAGDDAGTFTVPAQPWADSYEVVLDTRCPGGQPEAGTAAIRGATSIAVDARMCLLLRVCRDTL